MSDEIKNDKKQVTIRLDTNMIVLGLLSVLVFVSVVQTITLTNLVSKKEVGKSNLPAALKSIPQQVGGC